VRRPFLLWLGLLCCLSGCHIHAHYHAAPRQEAQVEGTAADLELTPMEAGLAEFLRGDSGDGS